MINRDEWLKMARECGGWDVETRDGDTEHGAVGFYEDELVVFVDAILERAASQIEFMNSEHTPEQCAYAIRALKTQRE